MPAIGQWEDEEGRRGNFKEKWSRDGALNAEHGSRSAWIASAFGSEGKTRNEMKRDKVN